MNGVEELRHNFGVWFNADRFDEIRDLFYAPDALLVPPDQEPIRGAAEIVEFLKQMRKVTGDVTLPNIESGEEGQLGYVAGRFSFPDHDPPVAGTTTEVYRRQADGSWRCVVDMFHPVPII